MNELDKILSRYARYANSQNTRLSNKARADLIDYMRRFVEWAESPDDVPLPDWVQKKHYSATLQEKPLFIKMDRWTVSIMQWTPQRHRLLKKPKIAMQIA